MARWQKVLRRMLEDTKPIGYDYGDVSVVLTHLGFAEAPNSGTSHRRWRNKLPDGRLVTVGFAKPGHGSLKAGYIREMVDTLIKYDLVPHDVLENES